MGNANTHFDRMNAFVDAGWLARLKPLEVFVWLIYHRHADSEGVAYPSNDRIARAAGHNQARHVREARAKLTDLGLLECIGRHPQAKTDLYRVNVPPILDTEDAAAESGHPAPIPGTLPQNGAPCPDSAAHPAPISHPHPAPIPGTKQHREQHREQHKGGKVASVKRSADVEIPAELDTPEFRQAWTDWQSHRREMKKPLTRLAAQRQLAKLERIGPAHAIATIELSIERGWLGLFAEHATAASGRRSEPAPSRSAVDEDEWKPRRPTIEEIIELEANVAGIPIKEMLDRVLSNPAAWDLQDEDIERLKREGVAA